MAPLKEKASAREIKVMEFRRPSKSVGPSKFKVYSENDKVNHQGRESTASNSSRTSLLARKGTSSVHNTCLKDLPSGNKETKASHRTLDKMRTQRKALADVSNVRGNSSRPEKPSSSSACRNSGTFGTFTSTASSSRPLVGNKANSSHVVTVSRTSLKASNKVMRKSSNFHEGHVRDTVENIARQTSRDNSAVIRKSFPVLERTSQSGASGLQGDIISTAKPTRKLGFTLRTRVGGKPVSQVSNLKSKAPKDTVNDGFIQRAPRNQTAKDALQRSRKSMKPIVRTTLHISKARTDSNSNGVSVLNKSLGTASRSARVGLSSVTKTSEFRGSQEVSEGRILAEGNDSLKPHISEITANKRSNRRKSYTSSLISRSKLVGDEAEVTEQKLPNIDDHGNPLEVAEYVDDIYQYYWTMEAESASLENYMTTQPDITLQMRGILINWLIEVHFKFDLMPETLYLTVALLDRYLSLVPIKKKEFQLVGLASLLLASKYEDFWHPRVKDLISISAETYTRKQVLEMEKDILKNLKFRLNLPTPYVFMLRFLKASQTDRQLEHLAFYLIELSLVEYEALRFRPSLLCASAVYVARCTLNKLPAWTSLLGKHAQYKEYQMRDCANMILKFHKAASTSLLTVTYNKYTRPEFGEVTAIRPLDSL